MTDLNSLDLEAVGTIVIDFPTVSLNKVLRWQRKEPWRYTKYKQSLMQWVMVASRPIPKASKKRHVHVVRTYRSERHRLDDDNFRGGCKPLLDALSHYGVIIDDSDEHAFVTYEQEKQTVGEDWVEVEVYDIV